MKIRLTQLALLISVVVTATTVATAQTIASSDTSSEAVAKEIGMLRQSVQSLDATLNDIADKLIPVFTKAKDAAAETQGRISSSFTLLVQSEQRAEMLRRQLLELIEKETLYRARITQIDEDMRPENVERALNPYGTTRTAELRDTRRRVLETDRRGYQTLLALATESRTRLEEEVRQADGLVQRLRLRLNPIIEKEIDKLTPQP
jgi:phosphoenolpyruvate-protein kinase (PTS system EI component)